MKVAMCRVCLLVAVVGAVLAGAPAGAAAAFTPCKKGKTPLCGVVQVPLDRSGTVQGSVNLAVTVIPARKAPTAGTLMMLAGGPGQGAIDSLTHETRLVSALPNFDLVAFDQRGTGASGKLSCSALRKAKGSVPKAFAKCAAQLGVRRGYYRSFDSSEDIEAVRQAIGSPKLSLSSVSYGGRVAGEYVRRHPDAVARQVLDSPSALAGTDPFNRQTQVALPRTMANICAARACPFTTSPFADLSRLAAKLAKRPLRGTIYDARGHGHRVRLSQDLLYELTTSLDLDPFGRGQFPGAVRSALGGDAAPLLRLRVGGGAEEAAKGVSEALFASTICSESGFPWDPAQAPGTARTQGLASSLKALTSAGAFLPFSSSSVLPMSPLSQCLGWPAVPPAPSIPAGQGPDGKATVPTLILEGAEDTRTPLEQAVRIAQGYSNATLLQIPYVGHSTAGTDLSKCAPAAQALFLSGGAPPAACPAKLRSESTPVTPKAPRTLRSLGKGSRRSRTVLAVKLTIADAVLALKRSGERVGGLRGGRVSVSRKTITFRSYRYVSGVRVTGRVRSGRGTLKVAGGGASSLVIRLSKGKLSVRSAGSPALTATVERWSMPVPGEHLRAVL